MSERWLFVSILCALVVAAPFPWYLFAVGGLLPISIIAWWAISKPFGIITVLLLVNVAIGAWAHLCVARFLARRLCSASAPRKLAGITAIASTMVLISLLPLYGGGENLAIPGGKFSNLCDAYRQAFG